MEKVYREVAVAACDAFAGALQFAVADPAHCGAAVAGLSHGAGVRHRRRQAAEFGEVGDGGVITLSISATAVR